MLHVVAICKQGVRMKVNGRDMTETIESGVLYAPARELAVAMGMQVEWDGTSRMVKFSKGCVCE
ncbi:stalk domain-containing protein [Brevibacillus choshinensis]|uniref:stalk domain-containing protein n=1 Tax=Brevibacillus choshinensis TaxID=54911 RepID=UPI002E2018B3|nr:stalk domain-containing protein [Brevibacillus choshinensis]